MVRLSEIVTVKRGASPRPIADPKWFSDGGPGWVRINDVSKSGRILKRTSQHLSDEGVKRSVLVYPGDIIMSISATVGSCAISAIEACIHDGFVVFKDFNKEVDKNYFCHALEAKTQELLSFGQTGTQSNINSEIVGLIQLYIPVESQQKRIAALLDSIDTAIEKTRDLIGQQKRVTKAYLERQFSCAQTSYRPLKSYLAAPIKNGVSVNYTEDTQGDIILTLGAVTQEGFNPIAIKNTPPALDLQKNAQLTPSDIVVGRSNTPHLVGFAGLYEGIPSDCYYPDLLMRVRINHKLAHPKYIEQILLSNYGRQYMRRLAKGTSGSMKKIDKAILENFPVIDKPLDQQQTFVKSVRIFEERTASLLSTFDNLKRLKTAISQQIFN